MGALVALAGESRPVALRDCPRLGAAVGKPGSQCWSMVELDAPAVTVTLSPGSPWRKVGPLSYVSPPPQLSPPPG